MWQKPGEDRFVELCPILLHVYERERVIQANSCGLFHVSVKGEKTQECHKGPWGSKYLETSFTLQTKPEWERDMQKLGTGSHENWLTLRFNKLVFLTQKVTIGFVPLFSVASETQRGSDVSWEHKTRFIASQGWNVPTRCQERVPETSDVSGRNHCFRKVLPVSRPQFGAKQKLGK